MRAEEGEAGNEATKKQCNKTSTTYVSNTHNSVNVISTAISLKVLGICIMYIYIEEKTLKD